MDTDKRKEAGKSHSKIEQIVYKIGTTLGKKKCFGIWGISITLIEIELGYWNVFESSFINQGLPPTLTSNFQNICLSLTLAMLLNAM